MNDCKNIGKFGGHPKYACIKIIENEITQPPMI